MTEEVNKYHTSKIYKISSSQCDKFYIGSTIQTLKERLQLHKIAYKRYIKNKIKYYMSSFDIVKFDDTIIELVKDVKCENKKELDRIEGKYIEEYYDKILNKNIAGQTKKEYNKKYYEENKDKISKHNNEYNKKYYEENKDKILEIRKEKFDCECGGKYTKEHKSHHERTKIHKLFLI